MPEISSFFLSCILRKWSGCYRFSSTFSLFQKQQLLDCLFIMHVLLFNDLSVSAIDSWFPVHILKYHLWCRCARLCIHPYICFWQIPDKIIMVLIKMMEDLVFWVMTYKLRDLIEKCIIVTLPAYFCVEVIKLLPKYRKQKTLIVIYKLLKGFHFHKCTTRTETKCIFKSVLKSKWKWFGI